MVAVALYGVFALAAVVAAVLLHARHAVPATAWPVRSWLSEARHRCGETASAVLQPVRHRIGEEYRRTAVQSLQGQRQFWNNIQLLRLLAAFAIV